MFLSILFKNNDTTKNDMCVLVSIFVAAAVSPLSFPILIKLTKVMGLLLRQRIFMSFYTIVEFVNV